MIKLMSHIMPFKQSKRNAPIRFMGANLDKIREDKPVRIKKFHFHQRAGAKTVAIPALLCLRDGEL